MPVRPAIGRPTPREARHRHGAPVRAPFLRCSVSTVTSATSVFSRSGEAAPRNETLTHAGG